MGNYADAVLGLSPIAYWRLGESSGSVANDSGPNALHGAYAGTCTLGADSIIQSETDKSLALAKTGYVSIGARSELNLSAFTIAGWLKLSSLSTINRLFANYRVPDVGPFNGAVLMVTTLGKLELFTSSSYINDAANRSRSTATLALNTVYHLAASFSNGTAKLYINGALDSTHTGKQTPAYTNAQVNLGGLSNAAGFDGVLDDVCVFGRVLSDGDIASLYAARLPTSLISGVITDRFGQPCQRKVYAMSRPTDAAAPILLAHGLSDPTTGAYELIVPTGEEVTRVVVSEDDDGPLLNDLVDRVIPA